MKSVFFCRPDVFNHNIETIERSVIPEVRPKASYRRSLNLLAAAAQAQGVMVVKSGLMVGLGERAGEVEATLRDLRAAGCSIVTIGQYLQPSKDQISIKEYVPPERFKDYEAAGLKMGFTRVFAGPYVRSSYKAGEVFSAVLPTRRIRLRERFKEITRV